MITSVGRYHELGHKTALAGWHSKVYSIQPGQRILHGEHVLIVLDIAKSCEREFHLTPTRIKNTHTHTDCCPLNTVSCIAHVRERRQPEGWQSARNLSEDLEVSRVFPVEEVGYQCGQDNYHHLPYMERLT